MKAILTNKAKLLLIMLIILTVNVYSATFTVTNTWGGVKSAPSWTFVNGSYAWALEQANATPGADIIQFDWNAIKIYNGGANPPYTINFVFGQSNPAVLYPVTIDALTGTTLTCGSGQAPWMKIASTNADDDYNAPQYTKNGIWLRGNTASNSVIQGLEIVGGRHGIYAADCNGITISRCVINKSDKGIYAERCNNWTIIGNIIGLDYTGTFATGYVNKQHGINGQGCWGWTIGGTSNTCDRNIISNNGTVGGGGAFTRSGLSLEPDPNNVSNYSRNASIKNNYIGTDITGVVAFKNFENGIAVPSLNNATIDGNIISGNDDIGILIQGTPAQNISIINNLIGVNKNGAALGNRNFGILIQQQLTGPVTIRNNNISSNGKQGIFFQEPETPTNNILKYTIQGNTICRNNSSNATPPGGIVFTGGIYNALIGGTNPEDANIICENTGAGINVWNSGPVTITQNSIYCNTTKGIELNIGTATGNIGYARPVITAYNSGTGIISGTCPAGARVEVYQDGYCLNCQAWKFLGLATVSGTTWSFNSGTSVNITAIATEPSGTYKNTSEISNCLSVALPVTLLSFDGKYNGTDIELSWVTSQEISNNYFIVERSIDMIHWIRLDSIYSINSSLSNSYYYIDIDPKEINYYRLIQVDNNNIEYKSSILSLESQVFFSVINRCNGEQIDLELYNSYNNEKYIEIQIFDCVGRELYKIRKNCSPGSDLLTIDMPSGIYLMNVIFDKLYQFKNVIVK